MAREWLAKRSHWLYWAVVPGAVASYVLLRELVIGLERQNVIASNLTVNIIIMIGLWGYYCHDLTDAVYKRIRRRKDVEAPAWLSWAVLVFVVLGLIYYLTLWGYETRW